MIAWNRAVIFSRRGKNGLCVVAFSASFHGVWLLCFLLLPFVEAFLQCSILHSWQIVCRGRFSATHSSSSGFTLQDRIASLFISQYPSFVRGEIPFNHFPVKQCSWSESMNHTFTCAGNTQFSLWFVISGLIITGAFKCFNHGMKQMTHWVNDQWMPA